MITPAVAKRRARGLLGRLDESDIVHTALRGRRGVMLDVGAHFGYTLGPFADDGWTVHAFEPDPANRRQLEAAFGDWPNVKIVPMAVSDACGEMQLFTSELSTGITSLAPFTDTHSASGTVAVTTLSEYMHSAGVTSVDFMKIDVEGFERNVLDGYDWRIRPRVIVLEFEDGKTVPLGYSWKDLADDLVGRGYEVLVCEWHPVQEYGTTQEWRRLERYPTELADPRAWGNLIAAERVADLEPAARRAIGRYRLRRRVERAVLRRRAQGNGGR